MDLEKAYDTVPREMVMATMRWMGVPEAETRMMEQNEELWLDLGCRKSFQLTSV